MEETQSDLDEVNTTITNLLASLTNLASDLTTLTTVVNEVEARKWQKIITIIGTSTEYDVNNTITDIFQIRGKSIQLQLDMDGWITGYFDVGLHYSNGTLCHQIGMENTNYVKMFSEIPIEQTGNYYLNITVWHYWSWNMDVWDYF